VLLEHSLDIHAGMVLERRDDALVDVFPARQPLDLLAFRLRRAGTTACFKATVSALVTLADSAVNVAPIVKATAIMHVIRPVTRRDIGNFLDLILGENLWFWTGARDELCHARTQTV
jgi:hypothetical protein